MQHALELFLPVNYQWDKKASEQEQLATFMQRSIHISKIHDKLVNFQRKKISLKPEQTARARLKFFQKQFRSKILDFKIKLLGTIEVLGLLLTLEHGKAQNHGSQLGLQFQTYSSHLFG